MASLRFAHDGDRAQVSIARNSSEPSPNKKPRAEARGEAKAVGGGDQNERRTPTVVEMLESA